MADSLIALDDVLREVYRHTRGYLILLERLMLARGLLPVGRAPADRRFAAVGDSPLDKPHHAGVPGK